MKTRHIAHIIIEADTPLKVGSNASDFLQDSPIQKDWNGLPMILGTSISGVLRKDFKGDTKDIFGEECGSKVIISNALLLDENKKVEEGLLLEKSDFLQLFDNLPIREHTAINDKGVAKENSKFDEEIVYKGTRFKFAMEMLESQEAFDRLIKLLQSSSFRLGGGATKGFGKFKILEIVTTTINTPQELADYSSSLNSNLPNSHRVDLSITQSDTHNLYTLNIKPDDFFMFGSGFGDEEADQTPVYEQIIDYETKDLTHKQILIPASSLKGALAHRTAFHYNKKMLDQGEDHTKVSGNNDAVKALFGHKKELAEDKETELGQKGKVIFSDCFNSYRRDETKVFDHVAIDRFTGGGIEGALFQEKTIAQKYEWEVEILLEKDIDEVYVDAFEKALTDVCTGMLALGGATTKGHGVFSGEVLKNGEVLNVEK